MFCVLYLEVANIPNHVVSYGELNNKNLISSLQKQYQNDDIVGVLRISNAVFEVPVVQGDDNDYYLSHGYMQEDNSFGTVFLDYRVNLDDSRKLLIYGHSSSVLDLSFNFLENYYDEIYYHKYPYLEFIMDEQVEKYEIFSVFVETSDFSYMKLGFVNNEDFMEHVLLLKSKSIYDTGVMIDNTHQILILQTCSNHVDYQNYLNKYLLIVARRIE